MPYRQPGNRHKDAVATKAVQHGDPCTEDGFVGTAFKTAQPAARDSAATARTIAIDEVFDIGITGVVEVPTPAGAAVGDPVYIREDTNALTLADNVGTDEVQTITINATGGTFTITVDGEVTAAIAYNANAAAVQAALELLSNVQPGDIVVTGGPGATAAFTLTFGGQYDHQNVPAVTTGAGSLTGGAGTATVATGTPGAAGANVLKFGRLEELKASSRCLVNLNIKDF